MNQINTVTIGKLIEAHREGDEQKFKTYVDFIVKAYEEQENDRAARIIRSSYTGDYGEQGKVVLDEATEQTVYYETGWYEPDVILEWAKTQPIFNNYYKTNKRCGCMYCPMSSYLNFAYLYKYYPENFRYMLEKMRETEELREKELGRPFSVISSNPKYNADYLEHIVKTKWLKKLNEMECTTKQKNIAAAKKSD